MGQAALLACDWGTTNLRAWTLDERGRVVASREFDLGVSKLAPGEASRRFRNDVQPALHAETLPAVLCGMAGSNLGWTATPYVDCPASLSDLAASLAPVDDDGLIKLAPGLRCLGLAGSPDVMRGEETQVFGWLAQNPERATGRYLLCHPGTHAKWMLIEDGRVIRFVTAMTGELFSILTQHSVLKSDAPATDMHAFDLGLVAAGEGDALAARLFTARARVVGGGQPLGATPSYLSGLLIGAEVASVPRLVGSPGAHPIVLLGDAALCALYARALDSRTLRSEIFSGEAAAIAGLFALYGLGGGK